MDSDDALGVILTRRENAVVTASRGESVPSLSFRTCQPNVHTTAEDNAAEAFEDVPSTYGAPQLPPRYPLECVHAFVDWNVTSRPLF